MKRWMLWTAGVIALVAVAAAVLWFAVLPPFVEKKIRTSLQDLGYSDPSISVERITRSGAILTGLSLGAKYGFRVGEIRVLYDLASLRRSRVKGIVLDGLSVRIAVQDKKVDWGPLAVLRSSSGSKQPSQGGILLPFDRIELKNAILQVDWEETAFAIPVEAEVRRIDQDSLAVNLHASVEGAPLALESTFNIATADGTGELDVDRLSAGILEKLAEPYLRDRSPKLTGHMNITGTFSSRSGRWLADAAIDGTGSSIEANAAGTGPAPVLTAWTVDIAYVHPDSAKFSTKAVLNGIPLQANGSIDPRSRSGECGFQTDKIQAKQLAALIRPYLRKPFPALEGNVTITGTAAAQENSLQGKLTLDGGKLSVHVPMEDRRLTLSGPVVGASFRLAYDGGSIHDVTADIKLRRMRAADPAMDLTVGDVVFDIPISLESKKIDRGTFSMRDVRAKRLHIPSLGGSFSVTRGGGRFDISGTLAPGARLNASGRFALGDDSLTAVIDARMPPFALENGPEIEELVPQIKGCEIGGTVGASAHIVYEKGGLAPVVTLDATDVYWKKPKADAAIEGISGSVTLNKIAPPAAAGTQQIKWETMRFGTFEAANGVFRFHIGGEDTTVTGSIEGDWAGGKIRSDSIIVKPMRSALTCDLHVQQLNLQSILDFLKYDGVKGEGKIDGNLPVTVTWGKRIHIAFGNGTLRANPQQGRLQLDKKTAMMFLGLTQDIDPQTAKDHDMANLLMLRALQDMEYTLLELDFTDYEKRGWVTRIQIKGHGPYGDEENRIPIGGIDIEINNLDDLLNSVILPGYQSRKLKLGGS